MKRLVLLVAVVGIVACGKSQREKQQEQFDRAIERAGGYERDEHGRPVKIDKSRRGGMAGTGGGGTATGAPISPPPAEWEPMSADDAKRECENKVQSACGQYALYLAMGIGVDKDRKRAEELSRKACENGGEAASCHTLAYLYETGLDGKPNPAKAVELYEKACDGRKPDACGELGMIYFNGGRSPTGADPDKSVAYLTKACEYGDRMSCHQIPMVKACIANPDAGGACNAMGKKQQK